MKLTLAVHLMFKSPPDKEETKKHISLMWVS